MFRWLRGKLEEMGKPVFFLLVIVPLGVGVFYYYLFSAAVRTLIEKHETMGALFLALVLAAIAWLLLDRFARRRAVSLADRDRERFEDLENRARSVEEALEESRRCLDAVRKVLRQQTDAMRRLAYNPLDYSYDLVHACWGVSMGQADGCIIEFVVRQGVQPLSYLPVDISVPDDTPLLEEAERLHIHVEPKDQKPLSWFLLRDEPRFKTVGVLFDPPIDARNNLGDTRHFMLTYSWPGMFNPLRERNWDTFAWERPQGRTVKKLILRVALPGEFGEARLGWRNPPDVGHSHEGRDALGNIILEWALDEPQTHAYSFQVLRGRQAMV